MAFDSCHNVTLDTILISSDHLHVWFLSRRLSWETLLWNNNHFLELISSLKGRSIPGFSLKIRSQIEALERSISKSPRGHFVSKNSLHGTCADRPAGNQCCPGQDWNCQPPNAVCSCDAHCKKLGDCCPDYDDTCGYMLTDGPAQCRGDATGRANGDPHYHTMDMKMIHFQGKCSYVLSKNCGDGPVDFKVVARNENRYGNMDMSWTKGSFYFTWPFLIT